MGDSDWAKMNKYGSRQWNCIVKQYLVSLFSLWVCLLDDGFHHVDSNADIAQCMFILEYSLEYLWLSRVQIMAMITSTQSILIEDCSQLEQSQGKSGGRLDHAHVLPNN